MRGDNAFAECVQEEYVFYRRDGKSRDETVRIMLEYYELELEDSDDVVPVLTGMIMALRKKRELFDGFAAKAREYLAQDNIDPHARKHLEALLADPAMYGQEAFYRIKKPYDPGWQYGDTFAHTITWSGAEKLGIRGWVIILYEYGVYLDRFHHVRHLMCVSVCPPDQIPRSGQALNDLGFLPVFYLAGPKGAEIQYHVSVPLSNKREEKSLGISKIGNFPDVKLPEGLEEESLLVSRSFIGQPVRDGTCPHFEMEFCTAYEDYLNRRRRAD